MAPRSAWPLGILTASVVGGCFSAAPRADQCLARFPKPSEQQVAADTTAIPALESLPLYVPADSLPQVFSADSATGWFRQVFQARLGDFPGGREEAQSFLLRFRAAIVGRADSAGWYAVTIPDPGPDTTGFHLLRDCIGATYGVFVRPVYSRSPMLFPR